ncbi:MAG: hypothetical protein JW904_01915 [Spirochaetales bacterium]|nr:hypothetical protein [Spirochaetales bacterium]
MSRILLYAGLFLLFSSCATEVKIPEIVPEEGIEKAPPLVPMEDLLYDVYTGSLIGKVKFINDDLTFIVLVDTAETSIPVEVFDEASEKPKTIEMPAAPYVGTFSGKNEQIIDTYFIYGKSSLDNLYIIIHDYNPMYKSIFKKQKPKGEHLYLVTVCDQKTFVKVMKRTEDSFDPVGNLSALHNSIRTQALIRFQEEKIK